MNPVFEAILARRSIRKFTDAPVSNEDLSAILEAGRWAPSGLNNQPWRFAIVFDAAVRGRIARLTRYGRVIEAAPVCLPVFMDREVEFAATLVERFTGYHRRSYVCKSGVGDVLIGAAAVPLSSAVSAKVARRSYVPAASRTRTPPGVAKSMAWPSSTSAGIRSPEIESCRTKAEPWPADPEGGAYSVKPCSNPSSVFTYHSVTSPRS